jgi:hypothetical protein
MPEDVGNAFDPLRDINLLKIEMTDISLSRHGGRGLG